MVSLGGLDLGYGSQMQLVRTNVLVLDTDPASFTAANAATCLSIAKQKFVKMCKPDYVVALETDLTTGYTTATQPTDQVENGVLRDHTAIPVAGGARDVTANVNRGLAIEQVLSVSGMQIATGATGTIDDLFKDASPTGIENDELKLTHMINSDIMKAAFDADLPAQTFSLAGVLAVSDFGGGTAIVNSDVSDLTDTSTKAALCTAIGDAAWIYSVTSLAHVL